MAKFGVFGEFLADLDDAARSVGETLTNGLIDSLDAQTDFVVERVLEPIGRAIVRWITPDTQDMGAGDISARQRGVLVNGVGNAEWLPVVYGTARVGGVRVFAGVSGAENQYLHIVMALCEGEIDAVESVYIDDTISTDAKFAGLLRINNHLGADNQTVDADALAEVPGWLATDVFAGVAYSYIRLQYNPDVFNGYPRLSFVVRGRKVHDPRTNATALSHNPALIIRDYLLNPRFGKGLDAAALDDAAFIAAADACDALKPPFTGAASSHSTYACDGVIGTSRRVMDNLRELLSSCRGFLPYSGGKYRLVIDQDAAPTFSFNTHNIIGGWSFASAGKRNRYNRVKCNYINPAKEWQPDIAPHDSPIFRSEDGGVLLEGQLNAPFTIDQYRALDLAELTLKQSRQGLACAFTASIEAMQVEVGDVVTVAHPTPGWPGKKFRVTRIMLLANGNVAVELQEHDSTVYDLDAKTEAPDEPDTFLPDPNRALPPANLVLASGSQQLLIGSDGTVISRIRATWATPLDIYVIGYEVEFKRSAEGVWRPAAYASGRGATEAYIGPVEDAALYDVQVRSVNSRDKRSAFVQVLNHLVIGKTDPPPPPTSFTVVRQTDGTRQFSFALNNRPPDFFGFKIRYRLGAWTAWEDLLPLHDEDQGVLTSSPWETNQLAAGAYTFACKTVDTSGNESRTALVITTELGDPRLKGVVVDERAHELGWPGVKTNCHKAYEGFLAANDEAVWGPSERWTPSTPVAVGQLIKPTVYNELYYECTQAGTTGSSEPAWSTTGTTVTDGTVQWFEAGYCVPYTWSAWRRWAVKPAAIIVYEHTLIDVGAVVTFLPLISAAANGAAVININYSTDNLTWSGWVAVGSYIKARYARVRITVTNETDVAMVYSFSILFDANVIEDDINDLDTATLAGGYRIGVGDIRVPITKAFASIKQVAVTLQNVGFGWTWELVDKDVSAGPRIKIYNSAGAAADALVDIYVRGI